MKGEKKIDSKVVFPGKMITVTYDTVELENGREAWREVVRHPGASAVLVILDDGSILLERQYRYALGKDILEIPAGKLDKGEDPFTCAQRELKEETGYEAKRWHYMGSIYTGPGFCDEVIHLYVAKDLVKGENHLDEDEFVELEIYSKEEVFEMIRKGELNDSKTLAALCIGLPYLEGAPLPNI